MSLFKTLDLSPILFSLFISELSDELSKHGKHGIQLFPDLLEIILLMFADDVVLVSDTIPGLQNQLNILYTFSEHAGLKINLDKTNIVVFRRGGRLARNEKWYLNDEPITTVNTYKYLGVIFSSTSKMRNCVNDLALRGKRALMEVITNLSTIGVIDPKVFFKIFDTQIQPILLYGAEIWGMHKFDQLERVHLIACKRFLNVSPQTPTAIVYGECGRYPLFINAMCKTLKYWIKLIRMNEDRIPLKVYKMQMYYDNCGYTTYASYIRNILFSHGFGYVWMSQTVGDKVYFINAFKSVAVNMFFQSWTSILDNSSRYSTYRKFKSLLEPEKYLSCIVDKRFRKILIKFRCGLLRLKHNEGRWQNINVNERICPLCNLDIEDEYHFLFICTVYEELRIKYIPPVYYQNPNYHKMKCLLTADNENLLRKVSSYVYHAFNLREAKL